MTQILCDKDMNYCRITLCDLRGLIIKERGTLGKVTIEGHDLFVLPLYSEEDIVYDLTEEGHYRGYAALFSRKTKEIFLWHLVEMARKYDDGNVMFPEKVRIPAFSLESLVRISDKSATLDKWKNWWFTCSYKVTRNRLDMGKSKLGRVRKYSNRIYQQPSESATHDTATAAVTATPNADLLGRLPYQFLFTLRNVAPAVLHQPSICNYSRVFTILSNEDVFRNQWNLIKHSELFLMLCTFSTSGIAPVPERTVIVNTDLTWRVIACNSSANDSVLNTPKHLVTLDSFLLLLDLVDKCNICPGIQNDNLVKFQ